MFTNAKMPTKKSYFVYVNIKRISSKSKVNSFYVQIVNHCYVPTYSSAAQNVRKFYKVTNSRVKQIKVWKNKNSIETVHGDP